MFCGGVFDDFLLLRVKCSGRAIRSHESPSSWSAGAVLRYAHSDDPLLAWLPGNAIARAVVLLEASRFFVMPELFDDGQAYLLRRCQVRPLDGH